MIYLRIYYNITFMDFRVGKEFPTATTGPQRVKGGEEKPFDCEREKKVTKKK